MMELIHDDDVEVRWVYIFEAGRSERLDRRENVLKIDGALASNPHLSERSVAHSMSKHCAALRQDFFSVGNEE